MYLLRLGYCHSIFFILVFMLFSLKCCGCAGETVRYATPEQPEPTSPQAEQLVVKAEVKAEQRRKRLESEDLSERDEADRGRDLIKKQLNFDTGGGDIFYIGGRIRSTFLIQIIGSTLMECSPQTRVNFTLRTIIVI